MRRLRGRLWRQIRYAEWKGVFVGAKEFCFKVMIFIFKKDPEQLPLDGTKTEGIVYAELDIARGQGNVMRRDDDKTEYAEIIHPKASETKVKILLNYVTVNS